MYGSMVRPSPGEQAKRGLGGIPVGRDHLLVEQPLLPEPVAAMSHHGVSIEEIAHLVGHASTRTTEVVYRWELRPVITTGAEIMDDVFGRR